MEETLQRRDSSDDGFSFPSTPVHDFEFEFSSPSSKNSPADHLFFNGKLLPHSFPSQKTNSILMGSFASRTSSESSKDSSYSSLMSSRSNSSNSSSSSARTSYSSADYSERRHLYHSKLPSIKAGRSSMERYKPPSNKDVVAQLYGSQRWQFITPPVPSLSRETSSRRRRSPEQAVIKEEKSSKEAKKKTKKKKSLCRRFFESFMAGCKQCHAMETQVLDYNHV